MWRRVVISPNESRNRLLAALPNADLDLLRPHLEIVDLDVHQVLEAPGDVVSHVYFIESGLVSIVGITKPDHRIEVGMIGYEGMTGFGVVLGNNRSANELLVQSAGSALRISTPSLRKIMDSSQSFTSTLLNYVHTFMVLASQTALANGRGRLDERLARWLLMRHDRLETNEFPTTHELLALLLGVRRAGVTVALHGLEGRGLIRSLRGRIRIVDRLGLQFAASGFYGIPECEYERSIGFASGKTFHQVLPVAYDSGEALLPMPSGRRRRRCGAPARNKH